MIGFHIKKSDADIIEIIKRVLNVTNITEYKDWYTEIEMIMIHINKESLLDKWDTDSVRSLFNNEKIRLKKDTYVLPIKHDPEYVKRLLVNEIEFDSKRKTKKKKSPFQITKDFIDNYYNRRDNFYIKSCGLKIDRDDRFRDELLDLSREMLHFYEADKADFDNKNMFLINLSDDIDLLTKKSLVLPSKAAISFEGTRSTFIEKAPIGEDMLTGEPGDGIYEYYYYLPEKNNGRSWFSNVKSLLYKRKHQAGKRNPRRT